MRSGGSIGQMTEKEWPIVEQMIGSLDPVMGEEDARMAFQKIRARMQRIADDANEIYDNNWSDTQYYAPDKKGNTKRAGSVIVNVNGADYTFPNAEAANNFKRKSGGLNNMDYAALAKEFGGTLSAPPTDLAALAAEFGGSITTPPSQYGSAVPQLDASGGVARPQDAIPREREPSPSVLNYAIGIPETALALGSGMVAGAVAPFCRSGQRNI